MRDTALASRGQPVERCASEQHRCRAKRDCLDDVRTAPRATIDENAQIAAHLPMNLRQHVERRRRARKLPAAMIRQHDAIRAGVASEKCVIDIQNAFNDHAPAPMTPYPRDIGPLQRQIHLSAQQRGLPVRFSASPTLFAMLRSCGTPCHSIWHDHRGCRTQSSNNFADGLSGMRKPLRTSWSRLP